MNIFLTMAGIYERFKKDGYKLPKYLLPWGCETILSKIIFNLSHKNIKDIFFIANKNDESYLPHIIDHLKKFDIPRKNLIFINSTSGQAETVNVALKLYTNQQVYDEKFCILNIDTILFNRDYLDVENSLDINEIYIDVFKSNNTNYSYVLTQNDSTEVVDIIEKKIISNIASSGMYGFKNFGSFLDFYKSDDIFISEVIKKAILQKKKITIGKLYTENDTIVLGSPSEYQSNSILLL